ncbi:regulatory protein RecX [Alkalitalea saponilacus]|uniref:Regulatory protein RecX n=1 Tax=Alkalitalea saponilacus TaxID=889453 RepID=A0A1T5A3Y9_9BACT|nr:regulatory protein RecX [Alkalitalea saponilacus]ASB48861.1 RecX family transcriptional regulator [Alkalitalea saponilacus]SKB29694.1 regulatory protein [Alkalitalea saponilacus]
MEEKEAFNKAAAICARQEKCISDIEKKLEQWGVENISAVIKRLVEEKYIDERRFAGFFVRDKFRFNHWGRKKIQWHLFQKQLPRDIIDDALNTINDDEYREVLYSLLASKRRQINQSDPFKVKNSLLRFAGSRGFEYDVIIKCLDSLTEDE